MNGIYIQFFTNFDDFITSQIRFRRSRRSDTDRFICIAYMQRLTIGFTVNSNGFNTHFAGSSHDAKRNFASIGNEKFFDRRHIFNIKTPKVTTYRLLY